MMETAPAPTLEEAKQYLDSLDFSHIINKMVNREGWHKQDAEKVCEMYRNFLFLHKKYGNQYQFPPSEEIDEFWHTHILDTKQYRKDCLAIFGEYFDHTPMHSADANDTKQQIKNFENLQKLYAEEFDGKTIIQVRSVWSKVVAAAKLSLTKKITTAS